MHGLIGLLCAIGIIGVIWWALTQIPMPQPLRIVVVIIVAIVAVVMLAQIGGLTIS